MKINAVIFDLDDTLIDTRERHFHVVNDFINSHGKKLSFDEYLNMRKENSYTNKEIIKNEYQLNEDEFSLFWKHNIEDPAYLKFDKEIVDITLLNKFKKAISNNFILLSLRSNVETAVQQFNNLSFHTLFDQNYFLKHSVLNPKIEKLKFFKEIYQKIIFISDSMGDCIAAKEARVSFVGVQTGVYQLSCNESFDNINSFLLNQLKNAY